MLAATEDQTWEAVLSSPLRRCHRFAESLARDTQAEFVVEPRFAEYDFGDWDGQTYAAVMEKEEELVRQFFADPFHTTPPNAEHFRDFHQRVVSGWRHALEEYGDRNVLIVTHGGVIMSVMAEILGLTRIHGKVDVGYACKTRIQLAQAGQPCRLLSHGTR